jgi:hypothetical protein
MGRQNFIYARCIKFSKVTLSAERCLSAENMTPAQPWVEKKRAVEFEFPACFRGLSVMSVSFTVQQLPLSGEKEGKRFQVTGLLTDTITCCKAKVAEMRWETFRVDPLDPDCLQRWVYNGKQLENEKTLADYNIKDGDTVHVVWKIRGG